MEDLQARKTTIFNEQVKLKYNLFNSLFLTLPFDSIYQTGTFLPIFSRRCQNGLEGASSPVSVVKKFFADYFPEHSEKQCDDILFNMIKYVERQVVLYDAIEDAAYPLLHQLDGPGTFGVLFQRASMRDRIPELADKLNRMHLRLVLTAHPTQFYPDTVLWIIEDLASAIRKNDIQSIQRILKQLGKTPFFKKEKPTPLIEAEGLIWFLEHVFYTAVSDVVASIQRQLNTNQAELTNPGLVQLGFWPGGDRDGNPFVNARTTREVGRKLKRAILSCYLADLGNLVRRLTFRGVLEPLRELQVRMRAVLEEKGHQKLSAADIIQSLESVREVLVSRHDSLFLPLLDSLLMKVRIFGVHFASLDIRQDSSKHRALMSACLKGQFPEYAHGDFDQKVELLKSMEIDIPDDSDPVLFDIVESIRAILDIQEENGEKGAHRYIISNCSSATQVLEVFYFIQAIAGDKCHQIDIVPLFETIDDLRNAGHEMDLLYRYPAYLDHLSQRGLKQTIMLGFSDGTKDGGYLSANWSIFRAKENLTAVSEMHDIKVVFFDGRGGPPARGGGKTNRFYSSLGDQIADHEIQLTIQGQTISSNFGTVVAARYNIEQLISAALENDVFKGDIKALSKKEKQTIDALAAISLDAYFDLKSQDAFLPYLQELGTLNYYGQTNIGSRPVKRKAKGPLTLQGLRAIPFVSAWNQMKQNVPGFYGLGQAIQKLENDEKMEDVKALYRQSLFFQAIIGNSMQSLAKSNFALTAHLRSHPEFGELWQRIHAEYQRTRKYILEISGMEQLMEDQVIGQSSIELRESIVLPVLVIQQYALYQLNQEDLPAHKRVVYQNMVIRSMFSIINAGRNSA